MNLKEYSERAIQTALNTNKKDLAYPMLGLFGEIGEVCEVLKKNIRDDNAVITDTFKERLFGELFDITWYINRICWAFDITFDKLGFKDDPYYDTYALADLALLLPDKAVALKESKELNIGIGIQQDATELLQIISAMAQIIGYSLEEGFDQNVQKLESRKARGVLHGSGSNR